MTDIYSAVKPLLFVSSALGLGPFSVDAEAKTVASPKYGIAYSFAVFGIYASISVYSVYTRFQTTASSFTYIGEYTNLVLLMCGIVVALCCLLLVVVQRKKVVAMIENFHGVDCQMSKLDETVPYVRISRVSIAVLASLTLLLSSLFVHDITCVTETHDPFFWVTYFAPVVFTTMMLCQFVLGGLLLRRNFSRLNERLTKFGMEDGSKTVSGEKKLIDVGYIETHLFRRSSEQAVSAWESDFSRFRIRKIAPRQDLASPPLSSLAKVKVIRKIHSNLCEIKELLNSSYSLQLLSTVAQAFIIITTNLYTLFTSGGNAKGFTGISFPIVWALYRSLELICITVTCTKISKTANHTAVIIHKLLSRDWDTNIRNQLKLFSIQLLHRKVSFSACGFFTLDMTLLHAIIGAATTYLVILIQFHNTYEESP